MLYKEIPKDTLQHLFQNPTAEYRATPFWAWNCKLEEEELLRQIDVFKEMGFGGFHMHSRSGLATEYLGEEFMHMVKACTEKAQAALHHPCQYSISRQTLRVDRIKL